jgi:hypothetical protein
MKGDVKQKGKNAKVRSPKSRQKYLLGPNEAGVDAKKKGHKGSAWWRGSGQQ